MIKISLLSTDGLGEMLLPVDDVITQQVLVDVISAARAKWIKLAGEMLNSTRRDYLDGIQEVVVSGNVASVSLVGVLPNLVEQGMSAFDMHDTLLGPSVPVVHGPGQKGKRQSKDGHFYRAIPFRHQTPGSLGQGGGAPMGSQYENVVEDAQKLGRKIHRLAKKLAPTIGQAGAWTQWGGRLPPGLAPKLKAHHSVDIFAGMVKQQKTYGKATQNTYTTFRMISTKVTDKWLHPGIEGVHLADEVQKFVEDIAPKAFAAALGVDL